MICLAIEVAGSRARAGILDDNHMASSSPWNTVPDLIEFACLGGCDRTVHGMLEAPTHAEGLAYDVACDFLGVHELVPLHDLPCLAPENCMIVNKR